MNCILPPMTRLLSWFRHSAFFSLCLTPQRTLWQQLVWNMKWLCQRLKGSWKPAGFVSIGVKTGCTECTDLPSTPFSFCWSVFSRIPIVPCSIECDRLVSDSFFSFFFFAAACLDTLAYRPVEHKTDWTDVSNTVRLTHSLCSFELREVESVLFFCLQLKQYYLLGLYVQKTFFYFYVFAQIFILTSKYKDGGGLGVKNKTQTLLFLHFGLISDQLRSRTWQIFGFLCVVFI